MRCSLRFFLFTFSLCTLVFSNANAQGYVVYERGAKVSRADIRRDDTSKENLIEIEALNVSGGPISLSRKNPVLPPSGNHQYYLYFWQLCNRKGH